MYTEDEYVMISALQHLLFCERQCALIHLEQSWAENVFTAEGQVLHEKVDDPGHETRKGLRQVRALSLSSPTWGLTGKCDLVEFIKIAEHEQVIPVEYKRGRKKKNSCDEVQLCAQALCLEDMMGVKIAYGELFYFKTRQRLRIELDKRLRDLTTQAIFQMHELFRLQQTPPAIYEKTKCDSCSLKDICLPKINHSQASTYIKEQLQKELDS